MKEYGKTMTSITMADGFNIVDTPFTATIIGATSPKGRSPQNLVCRHKYCRTYIVDKTVYIPPTLLHTSQLDSKI